MLQFTTTIYAMLAMFLIQSAARNVREARPHGRAVVMAGHAMMSMSLALGIAFAGWVALIWAGWLPRAQLPGL